MIYASPDPVVPRIFFEHLMALMDPHDFKVLLAVYYLAYRTPKEQTSVTDLQAILNTTGLQSRAVEESLARLKSVELIEEEPDTGRLSIMTSDTPGSIRDFVDQYKARLSSDQFRKKESVLSSEYPVEELTCAFLSHHRKLTSGISRTATWVLHAVISFSKDSSRRFSGRWMELSARDIVSAVSGEISARLVKQGVDELVAAGLLECTPPNNPGLTPLYRLKTDKATTGGSR